MATTETRETRFRSLHGKLERAVAHIGQVDEVPRLLEAVLEQLCREFREELGFEGGRVYTREGEDYVLCAGFGVSRDVPRGLRVPSDYPPHRRLLAEGVVLMRRGDPGVDDRFEEAVGVSSAFAAIGVGEGTSQVIAFSLSGEPPREDVIVSLSLVRHVINLKLLQRRMARIIDAARIVQEGILPHALPEFSGFDIASAFRPADRVSGDLFDYLPVSDCCIGIAIADSSGHGLPAALLARDVITALRTAAGQGAGVAAIVSRVNGVMQHAVLSGTFVTLFYGHLSADGTLEYCNAGHEPPLLVRRNTIEQLDSGGTVLGPIPSARYDSGTVRLEAGDLLVLYTDGIAERANRSGDFYGSDRIARVVEIGRGQSAQQVADSIMADADAFAEGVAAKDDMTVVVVRRDAGATTCGTDARLSSR